MLTLPKHFIYFRKKGLKIAFNPRATAFHYHSPGDPDAFVIPDISESVKKVEDDAKLGPDETRDKIQDLER